MHRSFPALQIVVKVPEVATYFPLLNRRRHLQLVDLQVQVLHRVSRQNFNKMNKNGGRRQEVRFLNESRFGPDKSACILQTIE